MSSENAEDDVALTILHTADWHLGARFPAFREEDGRRLMRARLDAVDRIFDLAERYDVDAVLAAGDLFDEPTPAKPFWEGLAELIARRDWSERPLVLLPGNHDPLPAAGGTVWAPGYGLRERLPAGVHIVDRDDFELPLGDGGGAVVHARPCRSQAGEADLALALPGREPGDARIRIGLVHGQTFDIDGHETNFPIAKDAAAQRGLDYLAIGDTHSFREVPPGAPIPTVYPGTPEPTKFGEKDAGCCALVFFRGRGARPRIHAERVARYDWREETCRSLVELRRLRDDESLRRTVLRLVLRMRLPLRDYDEAERIVAELAGTDATHGRVGVLQLDRSELVLETDDVEAGFGDELPEVLREVVSRLKDAAGDGPDQERARRALRLLYGLVKERR